MMSFLYLLAAFNGGFVIACHFQIGRREENPIWCKAAMGIGIGYLLTGWITYLVSYTAKVLFHLDAPKIAGVIAAMVIMSMLTATEFWSHHKAARKGSTEAACLLGDRKQFFKELLSFVFLFLFLLWTMFYVFHVNVTEAGRTLESGVSVFSDFAPHTAMIRSFSLHDNFPTQYPHYGGADAKYHFMFQFFAGVLEFLGLRIDWAFNLISAASLWGFLVLLYYFAKEVTGYSAAGFLSVFLFFCRSSFAGVQKLIQTIMTGDWYSFWNNTTFLGYTEHEDWGLWNYNVFLNQRHLGFGLLIGMIASYSFAPCLDWLDEGISWKQKLKRAFAGKKAWACSANWKLAAGIGFLLGGLAFWNGAATVAALLILFGLAIFSEHKLDYAVTAGIAVCLSLVQKLWFMDSTIGQPIGLSFQFGFLAQTKTFTGAMLYLLQLTGLFFIGIVLAVCCMKGKKRVLMISFLLPVIFAFTVSMTPDITVNHKYIMIAVVYLNIFWAGILAWLAKRNTGRIVAIPVCVLLIFLLSITGCYDLLTIYNKNKQSLSIDMDSNLTNWLKTHVTEDDLVLTGEDSMSEITLSGIMLYNGWPYYAWSAGYDTNTRAQNAIAIYTGTDRQTVKDLVKQEQITYIIYQSGMIYEEAPCSNELLKQLFQCVYRKDGTVIYKTGT